MEPPHSPGTSGSPELWEGFHTTHWSLVLAAADSAAPGGNEALEQLCRTYWRAVYWLVRRRGHSPEATRDLTQEFFNRFLEKKRVKFAAPDRGRFRNFLSTCVCNFLNNEWRHDRAERYNPGQPLISLDELREAETHFQAEPADPTLTPDRAFEKRWALTLLEQVLARLRAEHAAEGRAEQFDVLKPFVWGEKSALSQAEIGARLGMKENTVSQAVFRLRRRYGELLREEIAHTVASPAEIDEEVRYLISVISS